VSAAAETLAARTESLMKKKDRVLIAIDGPCAAGKSTLGEALRSRLESLGCSLFHMDDFFLRPFQRTPERLAQPGGNVDRERFLEEVLKPLASGQSFSYQKYSCQRKEMLPVRVTQRRIAVIEGVYSLHPDLRAYYDLKVFLDIDHETQRQRLKNRTSPDQYRRFIDEWIPLEEKYFKDMDIREAADLILGSEES